MNSQGLAKLKLPDSPGVYFFIGKNRQILYIGRATSLRDRVRSYFRDDAIKTRGPRFIDLITKSVRVDFVRTDSVLEAIILEANLIKMHEPSYNTKEKDDRSFNHVIITDEDFPRVLVVRGKDLGEVDSRFKIHDSRIRKNDLLKTDNLRLKSVFGPFPNGSALVAGLKIIRKIFPYRDNKCRECPFPHFSAFVPRSSASCRPCFNYQLGLCPGVCVGAISKKEYGKTVRNILLFFEGKKGKLIRTLEREMDRSAKDLNFEKAGILRNKIFALKHLKDSSVIKEDSVMGENWPEIKGFARDAGFNDRVEAYDVAHMSGASMGGVMVVMDGRHLKKSDYRLFRIKGQKGADDTKALSETLTRRLAHKEWPLPLLMVVDGAEAQKNTAEKILSDYGLAIPVVAVVKNERRGPDRILGQSEIVEKNKKEILLLNAEAHRFAVKYHRKLERRRIK